MQNSAMNYEKIHRLKQTVSLQFIANFCIGTAFKT